MAITPQQPKFPKLDAPFINRQGNIDIPWYQTLINMFQRTGGNTPTSAVAYLAQSSTGELQVFNASTGDFIGNIESSGNPGGPPEPIAVDASPFTYTAEFSGFVIVEGAKVEVSRDGGATWYLASLVGGQCPVRTNDQLRVTYFNAAPQMTFFPD